MTTSTSIRVNPAAIDAPEAGERDERKFGGQHAGDLEVAGDGLEARPRPDLERERRDRQRERLPDPPRRDAGPDRGDGDDQGDGAGKEAERSRHGEPRPAAAARRIRPAGTAGL